MKYLIGRKKGMTQLFLADGKAVAVTVIEAGPCTVTTVKTKEKDGYEAVQLGYDVRRKISKPEEGHVKGMAKFGRLQEFPQRIEAPLTKGEILNVSQFVEGDSVDVTGISKGKGFQGVVRRHHFGGSPATHGHKDQLRMPGSIGAGGPQRVFKGTRMAGHMGNERVTAKGLEVIEVIGQENALFVKGAIPGPNGAIVAIFSTSTTKPKAPAEEKKEVQPQSK